MCTVVHQAAFRVKNHLVMSTAVMTCARGKSKIMGKRSAKDLILRRSAALGGFRPGSGDTAYHGLQSAEWCRKEPLRGNAAP